MAASSQSPPPLPQRRRQQISLVRGSSSSSSRAVWRIRQHHVDDEKSLPSRRTRALLRLWFDDQPQQQCCDASTITNVKNRDNNDAIIIDAFVAGARCANTMTTTCNDSDNTDDYPIAVDSVDSMMTALSSEEVVEEKVSITTMSSNKSYSPTLLSIVDNSEEADNNIYHPQLQQMNNSSSIYKSSKQTRLCDNTVNGDRVVEATMVSSSLSDIDHDIAVVNVNANATTTAEAAVLASLSLSNSEIQHLSLLDEVQASSSSLMKHPSPVAVSMTLSEIDNDFSLNLSNIESNDDDDDDDDDNDESNCVADFAETAYEIDYSTHLCTTEASHYSREDASSSAPPSPIPRKTHDVVVVVGNNDNVVDGGFTWEDRDSINQTQMPSIDIELEECNENRTMKYSSADKILRQNDIVDKKKQIYYNDIFLDEDDNDVCNNITEERGRLLDEWMSKIDSECEGRDGVSCHFATTDQELRFPEEQHGLSVPFDFEIHDLTRVDKDRNTLYESTANNRPNSQPKSPSFGSISSKEASIDDFLHSSSSVDDEDQNENETLNSIDQLIHKSTLSECLAAVQDYLHDSSDIEDSSDIDSDTVEEEPMCPFVKLFANDRILDTSDEEPSPREQLVFKYPMYNGGIEDEVWLASDVDSDESSKSELEITKFGIHSLIDEITLLEDATIMQQEYIKSPSIDSSFDTSQLEMTDDESKPDTTTRNETTVQQLPSKACNQPIAIPTSKMTAQKLYFFKQPKHTLKIAHSNVSAVQEDDSDNNTIDRPVSIPSSQSETNANPSISSTSRPQMTSVVVPSTKTIIAATSTGSITPLRTQRNDTAVEFSDLQSKTSNTYRLEQIDSIKAKLHVETDLMDLVSVRDVPIPTPILRINELLNSTKTSARKCYFYKSPKSDKTRTRTVVNTEANEEHRSLPPSRFSFDTEIRKMSTEARVKLKIPATLSLTPLALQITRGASQHKSVTPNSTRRRGMDSPHPYVVGKSTDSRVGAVKFLVD